MKIGKSLNFSELPLTGFIHYPLRTLFVRAPLLIFQD
jgi:hypothetical protein